MSDSSCGSRLTQQNIDAARFLLVDARQQRVRVFTMEGTQIGLDNMGEGEQKLTFLGDFLVGQALQSNNWVRFATADELKGGSGPFTSLGPQGRLSSKVMTM